MPIKGKKTEKVSKIDTTVQPGFFECVGKKLDHGVSWIKKHIDSARSTYRSLNGDYVKTIRERKIFRVLPPSLVVLVLTLILIPFFAVKILVYNDTFTVYGEESVNLVLTEPLYDGEITQEINPNDDWGDVAGIGILVATYERLNDADYEFQLRRDDEIIFSKNFSALDTSNNSYYQIKFDDSIEFDNSSDYSFTIRVLRTADNDVITFYTNTKTGNIMYKVDFKSEFQAIVIISTVFFAVVFLAINFLINSGVIKNCFVFIICMLAYVLPTIVIFPAYTAPDEPYHFASALRLAQYDWSQSLEENAQRQDMVLPSHAFCLATSYFTVMKSAPYLLSPERIAECYAPDSKSSTDGIVEAGKTRGLITYAAMAPGLVIGDLFSDSPMVIFMCGRISNLLFTGLIIIFALSLIKKHRMILLAIVFIPMFLQQSIAYSYDGLLNALCILMIAYGIRFLTTDNTLRKRDVVIMIVALAMIGMIKVPYIVVAAPLLFVRPEKFSKHRAVKWILFVVLLLASVVPYMIMSSTAQILPTDGEIGYPISSLLHPQTFIMMVLRTLYHIGDFYINSTIGYFGWFDFRLDSLIIMSYLIFLLVVVLSEKMKLSRVARIWIFLAGAGLILSVCLAMYLSWTPRSSTIIEGVQGRYFLPALPLLMIALAPQKARIELPAETCYSFLSLSTLCYVITVLVGFY